MMTTRATKPGSAPTQKRGSAFFNRSAGAFFTPSAHHPVQAKLSAGAVNQLDIDSDGVESVLRSGGHALGDSTRSFMESQFQRDFSQVRIHTDARAADSAQSINAKAYTSGNDIVFGAGHYQPGTHEGKRLLAHELTHTVQQGANASTVQRTLLNCEQGEECPPRSSGEIGWAAGHGIRVEAISSPEAGLLVWGIPIDSASIRGLASQPAWRSFLADVSSRATFWQVRGFSDCQGSEARNQALRDDRALNARNALPETARSKVLAFYGAPIDQCIASNSSRDGRAHNRAAFFQVFRWPEAPEGRAPEQAPTVNDPAVPEAETPIPDAPADCSPSSARRTAEGCTPNPNGAHLPPVGGTHTESHAFEPCLLTERQVLASTDWCVDRQQVHGGERCYRQIPAATGDPGDQYCYSENCCHNSRDTVSVVDPGSPGAGQCCENGDAILDHVWQDVVPEFIDDPVRVTRDILGI